MEGSHVAADSICPALVCRRPRFSPSRDRWLNVTNVWVGAILGNQSFGLAQVLLIRSVATNSHRLALRAEIGENRSIVTSWLGLGRSNRSNLSHRTSSHGEPCEVVARTCRERLARESTPDGAQSTQSDLGRTLWQAPPCESFAVGGSHRSAGLWKTTHPLDNFDLRGLGTLERFDSPAAGADCAALTGGSGRRERSAWAARPTKCGGQERVGEC